MALFPPAVEKTLNLEGGYQNNASDTGNYNAYSSSGTYLGWGKGTRVGTNRGISAGFYSSVLKRALTVAEMQSITATKAAELYKANFWDKVRGDQINDQLLAELVFDTVVHHGTGGGTTLIQKALNKTGANLTVDGGFGNNTFNALNSANGVTAYNAIRAERIAYYNASTNSTFRQGWLNRMKAFPERTGNTPTPPAPGPTPPVPGTNPPDVPYDGGLLPETTVTASRIVKDNGIGTLIGIGILALGIAALTQRNKRKTPPIIVEQEEEEFKTFEYV